MDLESKTKDICEIKENLVAALKMHINHGIDQADAKEAGEVADIIKDLAEAEKACYESEYYKTVIKAMHEKGENEFEEDEAQYGYRPSKTRHKPYPDTYMGDIYRKPYLDQEPYIDDYLGNERMGYHINRTSSGRFKSGHNPRHGQAYNQYQESRRGYMDTHSEDDKYEMNVHAQEHVADTIATIRDIWKSADPELKKRIKADFTSLLSEMSI